MRPGRDNNRAGEAASRTGGGAAERGAMGWTHAEGKAALCEGEPGEDTN